MWVTVMFALLGTAHAGRAPYLGGDIQELIEATKAKESPAPSPVSAIEKKPVTEKQIRDSSTYNAKFADIAKAYAEGYKAAIKAVQARAFIAKRRLLGIKPKASLLSLYKGNPYLDKVAKSIIQANPLLKHNMNGNMDQLSEARVPKSTIPVPDNVHTEIVSSAKSIPTTNDDKGELVTKSTIPPKELLEKKTNTLNSNGMVVNPFGPQVNAIEKSAVPPSVPQTLETAHRINLRSTHPEIGHVRHPAFPKKPVELLSEEERSRIAKLNARARHRNIYYDAAGGDPFRGGVLSVQPAISEKKHRRSIDGRRRRRRRAYYEVEYAPFRGMEYRIGRELMNEIQYEPIIEEYGYERRRRSHDEYSPGRRFVRDRRSHMPYLGQNLDAMGVVRAIPRSWTPPQRRRPQPLRPRAPPAPSVAYLRSPPTAVSPGRLNQFMPPPFRAPAIAYLRSPPAAVSPERFNQLMPPAFRGTIPQPMAMRYPMAPMPPMPPNYAAMLANQQAYRSMVPNYAAYLPPPYGYGYPAPMPRGVTSEEGPSVETQMNNYEAREKKSSGSEPEVDHHKH